MRKKAVYVKQRLKLMPPRAAIHLAAETEPAEPAPGISYGKKTYIDTAIASQMRFGDMKRYFRVTTFIKVERRPSVCV
jgi:hypothetical protein